ncbi:response regulator transcription factor [Lachnospira multipara]|uniref:Stage 0 sporulation protein A homolog n=1 Tax=Lachnospira multipara TaxID=28051 RepID=A0A1H5X418_9FIRM|nr:response regulator transcription factor [Lachnospira multipara]SEG06026.1 DNA-binding response regulator, OmpR family, contains REC and winged-helix (wHTH) domain [Lachnospira multipara]
MSKLLIIEDEVKIARFVELELKHEGYEVDFSMDGREGLEKALTGNFNLILLDIMLPGLNGLEVLRRIRANNIKTPVIMLTARDAVMDKVSGLDAGADDYITKPFAIEELLARIRVSLKHNNLSENVTNTGHAKEDLDVTFSIKGVDLSVPRHEVLVKGDVVELTNREFELLKTLMENKNIVLNREQLLNKVCGYDYMGETNIIDVYVRYLRTKIDDKYQIKLIQTIRGVGYAIKE